MTTPIQRTAVLVSLKIDMPDKKIFGAAALADITRTANAVRATFRARTLPWDVGCWNFVNLAQLEALEAAIEDKRTAFQEAVGNFVASYDSITDGLKAAAGDPAGSEFPEMMDVLLGCSVVLYVRPVPCAVDFETYPIPQDYKGKLAQELTAEFEEKFKAAYAEFLNRAYEVADIIFTACTTEDKKIYASWIKNAVLIEGLMPEIPGVDDPACGSHAAAIRVSLRERIGGINLRSLRKDSAARASLAGVALDICNRVKAIRKGETHPPEPKFEGDAPQE